MVSVEPGTLAGPEMARIWMSGNEYNDTRDGGAANGLWDTVVGTVTVGAAFARSGFYGARVNPIVAGSHYREKTLVSAANSNNDCKYGFVIQPKVRVNTLTELVVFSGTTQFSLRSDVDGHLELWNDIGIVQVGGDSAILALDTWYWINLTFINGTAVLTAKIDGASFASGPITAGGIEVLDHGIGISTAATGEFWYDDHVFNDQTGANETGEPGDQKIIICKPNAAGDSANGSRGGADSGSDFGQLDEDPPNDATDYYILDIANDRIEVNCEAASLFIGANDTVKAVQPVVRHRAESAALMSYAATIKSQALGTRQTGNTITHNDATWKTNGDVLPRLPSLTSYTDPQGGGAWTTALLDTAQPGVIAIDATPDVWITSLAFLVAYVPVVVTTAIQDPILSGGVIPFAR